MKRISLEEVKRLLGKNNPLQGDYGSDEVLWHKGGKLEGDIDLDNGDNVVVTGDLQLEGSIVNTAADYGRFLVVTGSLKTKNIIAGGSEVYVFGDATIENAILGHYNDGILHIRGKTKARAILYGDHDCGFEGGTEGLDIDLSGKSVSQDFELPDILSNEFIEPEGYVDEDALMQAILSGKEFLKKGAQTKKEKLNAFLKELLQHGATEIDLSGKNLSAFPKELTSLSSLRSLNLSGNLITSLPPDIAKLRDLEALNLSHNQIDLVPREFGQLKSLRKLLARRGFTSFPEVIGELENLEELDIGGLFDTRSDDLAEFPLAVTELKKLRKLDLSDNAFKAIPEKILNLENLEELNLDGSLSHVRTIPDFSKLKNLKTLNLNGLPSELLAQVFRATSLEHLYVGHLRPPLNTLPEAIGDLVHLKTLDVASNNITHLPESFFRLTKLETINLDHNQKLSWKEFQKLAGRLSGASFVIPSSVREKREDKGDKNWQKVHKLVQKAAADLQNGNYEKALKEFGEVIELCLPDKKWHDYDHLYAHYGKMQSLLRMLGSVKDPKERARMVAEIQATAIVCLTLVREQASPIHFSDESAFHREITRSAGNALAWYMQEQAGQSDIKLLEEALEYADQGIGAMEGTQDEFYIWDTKVSILLKLGRVDEAYAIVQRVLKKDSSFADFQDIKNSAPYKAWLVQERTGGKKKSTK